MAKITKLHFTIHGTPVPTKFIERMAKRHRFKDGPLTSAFLKAMVWIRFELKKGRSLEEIGND